MLQRYFLNGFRSVDPKRTLFSEYFYKYFKKQCILGNNEQFNYRLNQVIRVLDYVSNEQSKVLDIGCGFGLQSIMFFLCGIQNVYACDIAIRKLKDFRKLVAVLSINTDDIKIFCCNGCSTPFKNKYFDLIFISSVLSHVETADLLLYEIYRILKPEGKLFLSDENNCFFIPGRRRRRKIWQMVEYGPIDESIAIGEPVPFSHLRDNIISKRFPLLSVNERKLLVKKLKGL